jgi:N-acetylneuraminic acid mutarotase
LIAVMLLLALAIGVTALVGSGILKLPVTVEASGTPLPSSTPLESASASSSPIEQVPASWTATGVMVEARTNHTATRLLDGRVLVAGGIGTDISEFAANILASAELYDPSTGRWTSTEAMGGVRVGHTATLLADGRVLVAGGGSSSDGDGGPLASAELYDPNTGTWTPTGNMIGAGTGRTATLLESGLVLVAGGSENFEPSAAAELYDPDSGSWTATDAMLEARSNPFTAVRLLDGKVLAVGGGAASAETYDPSAGQWTATGPLAGIRVGNTATLLPDGRVLVAGGMAGTGALAVSELYDPTTGQWTATGDMLEGRIYHLATTLADGRVLVTGGTSSVIDGGVISSTAELYDPRTGSWTATVSMAVRRSGQTITLLGDGTALVAGGSDSGEYLASAELYSSGRGT